MSLRGQRGGRRIACHEQIAKTKREAIRNKRLPMHKRERKRETKGESMRRGEAQGCTEEKRNRQFIRCYRAA